MTTDLLRQHHDDLIQFAHMGDLAAADLARDLAHILAEIEADRSLDIPSDELIYPEVGLMQEDDLCSAR